MITIDYFSDVLCVWAYGGQIRLDELQSELGDEILVRQRFMPLFADTGSRIGGAWRDKGGFEGFGRHMRELCAQWEHTNLHGDVWTRCRPSSCTTAHVFLTAAGLCLGVDDDGAPREVRMVFDRLVVRVRKAFFEQAQDISRMDVLRTLLAGDDPPFDALCARIDDGEAYASLHRDAELMKKYGVQGSPTYVFNEGRQLLYGNVGYRIIESNLRELLAGAPLAGEPSWC